MLKTRNFIAIAALGAGLALTAAETTMWLPMTLALTPVETTTWLPTTLALTPAETTMWLPMTLALTPVETTTSFPRTTLVRTPVAKLPRRTTLVRPMPATPAEP
jgi:hypothetical protein